MTTSRSDVGGTRSRRTRRGRLLGAAASLAFLLAVTVVLRARSFDAGLPPALATSAGLPVTLSNGQRATLRDVLRPGRATVISLWASWCAPCRLEAPRITQLHRRFGDRINLVYLNVRDDASTYDRLAPYLSRIGLSARNYARMDAAQIAALTGARDVLIPRTLVFSAAGVPLARITGYRPLALNRVQGLIEE